MSLPDSLLASLDDMESFNQLAEDFLLSRKQLIERLVSENDSASLTALLDEDQVNLSLLQSRLIEIRNVMSNVKMMREYVQD